MTRPTPLRAAATPTGALVSLALLALLAACGGGPPSAPAAADASYTVRGEIVRLPGPDSADVLIRHEPIPDFKNPAGEVVGMDSMTMPFALAAGESLGPLEVGARVEFRLEMRWNAGAPATASAFRPLPAGTRLSFDPPLEPARAAGSAAQEGETPR